MEEPNLITKIRLFRLIKNGLLKTFDNITQCTESLCGIQSQQLTSSYISLFNRVKDLDLNQIKVQLEQERSIIRIWGIRHTLHLYSTKDWPIISAAVSDQKSWFEKKIKNVRNDNEIYKSSYNRIIRLVKNKGIISKEDIQECFPDKKSFDFFISPWGGILIGLSSAGIICSIQSSNKKRYFAERNFWLPNLKWRDISSEEANENIFERYLSAYGPAGIEDFAFWKNIPLGLARNIYDRLKKKVMIVKCEGKDLMMLSDEYDDFENFTVDHNSVLLLYRFDPLLLAYKDKSLLIDACDYKKIWRIAGIIEGSILINGFIVGSWKFVRKQKRIIFNVCLFKKIDNSQKLKIKEQLDKISIFLGYSIYDYYID